MSEKLKQMRAAKKAAKENSQREIDRLDRELCKVFAVAESAGGRSGGTRPARNPQPVSTDSAEAARARMNDRLASDEPNYNGMNAYQAELSRKRRRGEIPD